MNKSEIEIGILKILKDKYSIEDTDKETPIGDLGLDSLDIFESIMDFEREFKVSIPDEDWDEIETINDLVNFIDKQLNP